LERPISIAIHGGAGTILKSEITSDMEKKYIHGLSEAISIGYESLNSGKSAVTAVEEAVTSLENNPLFNAGKGSVFNHKGLHEMDASIMNGENLNAGGVCCISSFKNPIKLARLVMEKSEHVILTGSGAMEFGNEMKCEKEKDSYFFDKLRYNQWLEIKDTDKFQLDHSKTNPKKFGTVGAVALDQNGSLAAATSTGGMTNKKYGRIGDSSIIGAGNYANNKTCAVSCTGSGEYFIRGVTAYDLSCLIEMGNLNLKDAANKVIHQRMKDIGGDGGLIAIDKYGNITMPFNTEGMYRAAKSNKKINEISIY
jgi:beta-aspartyl-peptidase (threonine type)